eukprot:gene8174-19968_t
MPWARADAIASASVYAGPLPTGSAALPKVFRGEPGSGERAPRRPAEAFEQHAQPAA